MKQFIYFIVVELLMFLYVNLIFFVLNLNEIVIKKFPNIPLFNNPKHILIFLFMTPLIIYFSYTYSENKTKNTILYTLFNIQRVLIILVSLFYLFCIDKNIIKIYFPIYILLAIIIVNEFFLRKYKTENENIIIKRIILISMIVIYSATTPACLSIIKTDIGYSTYVKIKENGFCKGLDMFLHKHLRW